MMLHISISPKVRILERQDVVVEGPEGAVGAVLHALIEGVNDSVLEVRFPGKGSDSGLTLRVGKLVVAAAGHIHAGPGLHQRDLRTHKFRYARRCVESDGVPNRLDIAFGDAVPPKKITRGIRAIHFEA